jgi:hypothetical protein
VQQTISNQNPKIGHILTLWAAADGLRKAGVPDLLAKSLIELWGRHADGWRSPVTQWVAQILGRRPRKFAELVRDNAAVFAHSHL